MIKYDSKKAVEYFERSKYKELEKNIGYADTDKMSSKEIVQLISFKALVEQKLHRIYWSAEVAQLAILALRKADIGEYRYLEAKLLLNEAQIIIRNKKDNNRFKRALYLLSFADECFSQQGRELDGLFVKDEKLRTIFEMLKSNSGVKAEEINRILNAKFHSLRLLAYSGYPYAKILGREVAEKFYSRSNKLKALAARIYTLGRVGFYINEFLAWARGE